MTAHTAPTGQTGQTSPTLLGDLLTRHQIILGLRALAAFLEANPDVPVNRHGFDLLVSARADNDTDAAALVDHAAALMDVEVTDDTDRGGHYIATRSFGPITYRVFHIPEQSRRAHDARDSYRDNIRPDTEPDQDEQDHADAGRAA